MAILKDGSRQWALTAKAKFTFADADGVTVELVDIPGGATVIGGSIVIVNAFDSATSATLKVGDKSTTDRFASGVNAKVAGGTSLVPAGSEFTVTDALTMTITNVGTPTVGDGYVLVSYIMDGRSNEVQPV